MFPPRCNCDDSFKNGPCVVHGIIGKKEYERLEQLDPFNFFKPVQPCNSKVTKIAKLK